ncbi:MarR family winged helix-turn-helix transcriptional regulator [Streptomyces sp. NBC_00038]|uniref:MarR family winged helix-turn-helix transcriptional regulator n=1 Tax=Streptomyces sp. NBC_00038 TaxID=2903615 RepID=UPI00224CA37E|nr:MarR family winged helix-turn-helix transcriptional regulator [Streptomyces sp. NBC_00038]MCX5555589.1 MarR family winged helix-turn-helix transcriptional regulator [Streptomyces sp. NBC_00038]
MPTQQPQNPAGQAAVSEPLSDAEERLWRALQRMLVALPRALDEDLLRSTGLSLTQYIVLAHLSEADGNHLRMTDLAAATALSASRITRLVETLRVQGLVVKRPHSTDARGHMAVLTEAGRQRLVGAYPAHLASARRRVMDQLHPALVHRLAEELQAVADPLLSRCPANPDRSEPKSVYGEAAI